MSTPAYSAARQPTLGLLAFGDSITNGGGEPQWGVALHSWALWTARALGLAYTGYALDGARVEDVVNSQLPAFLDRTAHPDRHYEVGCLYVGVNDVRALDWDAQRFERGYRVALEFLAERSEHVLAVTAPIDLGRPRARARVLELNAVIERVAAQCGALLLDLAPLRARNLVMADRVHLSALGQIAVAERALEVLAGDGLEAAVRPSSLIVYEITWRKRLRGDFTYSYRYLKGRLRTARDGLWLRFPRAGARRASERR